MGGVIGALSPKLVLTAGTLLFSARISMHDVSATIDPSAPTTQISAPLARQLRVDGDTNEARRYVGLDRSILRLSKVSVAGDNKVPLTIGADALRKIVLLIDLKAKRLRWMDSGELHRATSGLNAVETSSSDNCLILDATGADGKPLKAALIGSDTVRDGATIPIRIGETSLSAEPLPAGRCAGSDVALGWSALEGKRVLLDLGHNRIWIS